ncbi:AbrB/MazE/SpoVT family DNA-binding domain-containing protein [Hydrogenophaga sp.]|uniref:AbrB/MazE/SpoVT family DNA-binding domain-containing protein n=1 Tax=Hydrogenophaga sp. TaxID=1904254 RepID=UPI0025BBB688|nr:AbrB/MazE/SpoVT family DNA-binding domain-containing protein [Hydrogenophaga sp.]MBT9467185.1 AbrB/MazE/SpoVT family DNA-binding domain-containing protein [Hydrogenophaga sp.]
MSSTATPSGEFLITIPNAVRDQQRWKAGQALVLIPKGKGSLLMPAPDLPELAGIARSACNERYRDRQDRY